MLVALVVSAARPRRGVTKFYRWLRLRLSTAAAETFYGWLRLMNSTAAYGGGSGAYWACRQPQMVHTCLLIKACKNSYGVGLSRKQPRDLITLKKCSSESWFSLLVNRNLALTWMVTTSHNLCKLEWPATNHWKSEITKPVWNVFPVFFLDRWPVLF